jgi:tetratricopeptide (TPR) repeat protein
LFFLVDWLHFMFLRWIMVVTLYAGGMGLITAATLENLEQRVRAGDATVMAELDAVTADDAQFYQARFLKARFLTRQGNYDAAMAIYQQLIKLQPNQPEAYNNLASLLAKKGDLPAAQKLLEQAMKTHPGYAAVYENLSTVYVELARDSYGKALRLDQQARQYNLAELEQPRMTPASSPAIQIATAPVAVVQPKPVKQEAVSTPPVVKPETIKPVTTAAPAVSPAPVRTAAKPAKPGFDEEQVITTLQGWAAAWAGKAPDMYFAFYDKQYAPPGQQRPDWEAQRRERLTTPQWIKVDLSDFKIKPLPDNRARVRLVQEYQSEDYRDRIRKELVLHYTHDGWRIIAERKIAALH